MRRVLILIACLAVWLTGSEAILAQSTKIDLRTRAGVAAVKGQWRYQIAIFGINGPISDIPTNWIFLGPTFLELVDKK